MAALAIIANPHAHRNRNWPLAARALRKAAPGAQIHETGGARELEQVARTLAAERPRVIAIAGGDGTVTHTVTALSLAMGTELPPISLLGGGAYDSLSPLGGPGDADDRLRRLAEAVSTGAQLETTERDTLRIEGRCGFRFGVGLPVRFIEEVYAGGKTGPVRSAVTLARVLGSSLTGGALAKRFYAPLELRVTVDGEEWPRLPLYGLVCATVAEAGLGARPFRRATEQPGFFQLLGLTAGPRKFALELPRLLFGRHARRDRLLEAVAERLELVSPAPFRWFLDGEIYPCTGRLQVGLGPRVTLVRA